MKCILSEVAKEDHSKYDCFMCAILSHGGPEHVSGIDENVIIHDLVKPFKGKQCPTLLDKPKVFIIQACRGKKVDLGVEIEDDDAMELSEEICHISDKPDFLVAYSSSPGFKAYRNVYEGSWFIQRLSDVFEKDADKLDIMALLTKVSCTVAAYENYEKQIPSIVSTLTKRMYLSPNTDAPIDMDAYRMGHPKRVVSLIINNCQCQTKGGSDHCGTDDDIAYLEKLFKGRGFNVKPTSKMLKILEEVAKEDHSNNDCFMCAIFTDGSAGGKVDIDNLVNPFKGQQCPSLINKPKIFIILACRCDKLNNCAVVTDDGSEQKALIPIEADFLYAYSAAPDGNGHNSTSRHAFLMAVLPLVKECRPHIEEVNYMTNSLSSHYRHRMIL
ncbi:Caspase-3 [Lamellibrachia satsuma]|nr:Caspase-3 [Lamellibrachia satsuma]